MAVTFEDAIRKVMKAYWADKEPETLGKLSGERKYSKKYFDSFSEEMFGKDKEEEIE